METPRYTKQIAPPTSTGEVLDNQSANLASQRAQAIQNLGAAQAGAIQSGMGVVDTLGGIFQRKRALSQAALVEERLLQLNEDAGNVPDSGLGGSGLLGNLNKNRNLLGDWQSDESGMASQQLQNWEQARLDILGEGLEGEYLDNFRLRAQARIQQFGEQVDSLATGFAYETLRTADALIQKDYVENPNTNDPAASIAEAVGTMTQRYQNGIASGLYSPAEAAEGIIEFENAMIGATYMAIDADIQDADGWVDPMSGEFYRGYDGALEMIEDKMASGELDQQRGAQFREAIVTKDTEKYSRGVKIQQEESTRGINYFMKKIENGDVVGLRNEILNYPGFLPAHTQDYNRTGDTGAQRLLTGILDGETGAGDEDFIPMDVFAQFMDPTKSDVSAQTWLLNNADDFKQRYGMTDKAIQTLFGKSRDQATGTTAAELQRAINGFYGPALEEAGDDLAAINEIESDKIKAAQYLQNMIERPNVTAEDVPQLMSNFILSRIEEDLYKDYMRADPRKTNPLEMMIQWADQGLLEGVSGATHLAENVVRAQALQKDIVSNTYGEVTGTIYGPQGTSEEGQIYFKVFDRYANEEIWVRTKAVQDELGGLEEKFFQARMETNEAGEKVMAIGFDGKNIWDPASLPGEVASENAANVVYRDEVAAAERDVALGWDWDRLVAVHGEELMVNSFENGASIPGGPDSNASADKLFNSYLEGDNQRTNYQYLEASTRQAMQNNEATPEDVEVFFERVSDHNQGKIIREIDSRIQDDSLSLFRNNGNLRTSAIRSIASIIAEYGLPPSYAQYYLDTYLNQPDANPTARGL